MELSELRKEIDAVDKKLIELLERRFDIAAGIAAYKRENALPVLDAEREKEKLAALRTQCRAETAPHISGVFKAVMASSRAYQAQLMEKEHG